jgi:type IV pilus biogenesis protein CpaD/CtpE
MMCPNCGEATLSVQSVSMSRPQAIASKVRAVQLVECTAACGVSDRQLHEVGLMWSSDSNSAGVDVSLFARGADRCDVGHPTLPDTSCVLRVGHGAAHRCSAESSEGCEWH